MLLKLFAKGFAKKIVIIVKLKENLIFDVEFDKVMLLVISMLCLYSCKSYC